MSEDVYNELILARRELELQERQAKLKRDCGIAFYEPHIKQHKFHAAGAYKRRYLRTGNRFGKSTAGIAETIAWLLGERIWYKYAFDVKDQAGNVVHHHDPAIDGHLINSGIPQYPVKGILIVCDWDKCEEIFTNEVTGKIWQFLPKGSATIKRNQSGKIAEVYVQSIHGGQSVLYVDTVESWRRNKLSQESSDWDFAHLDEPLPEAMWKAIARGFVDRDGSAWFCCTPLNEMWINDRFLPSGNIRDAFPEGHVEFKDVDGHKIETWIMTGSMHDNIHLDGLQKARYIAELSEQEKATRIDGRPAQLVGVVYNEFDPTIHIYETLPIGWTRHDKPPANYTIRLAVDTHPKTATAVLFAATSPAGRTFIYDEIFETGLLIPGVCELIHYKLSNRHPHRFLLELAAYTADPIDGYTIADVFADHGFPIETAPRDLTFGIMEVKSALRDRDRGHPTLLFSPLLIETRREFDRYVWDADKNKPCDRDDHMMENLYRLVISDLSYVDPNEQITQVLYSNATRADFRLPGPVDMGMPGDRKRDVKGVRDKRYRVGVSPEANWQESDMIDSSPEYKRIMKDFR